MVKRFSNYVSKTVSQNQTPRVVLYHSLVLCPGPKGRWGGWGQIVDNPKGSDTELTNRCKCDYIGRYRPLPTAVKSS